MIQNTQSLHDMHQGNKSFSTFDARTDWDLILVSCQITVPYLHSLFLGFLVKLAEVVDLFNIFRLSLSFVVEEWRITVGIFFLILYISKNVEQIFVMALCVLNHVRCVVFQVFICSALSRLVGLVFLRTHSHHIFDSPFNDCSLDFINTQNKFEKITQFYLRLT